MPTPVSHRHSVATSAAIESAMGALPTLRSAWFEACDMALKRNVTGLRPILDARLERIKLQQSYDEPSLLLVVEECQTMVASVAGGRAADEVGRRMRRGIYEFLLALDAHSNPAPAKPVAPPAHQPSPMRFAPIDMSTLRGVIAQHMAAGLYHDAASILTRVSRNQRGMELAAVACAAGVACRAAGDKAAAAACFQASCIADPEYEARAPRLHP